MSMDESYGLASGSGCRLPKGILVGHCDDQAGGSGCTVLLAPDGCTGAVAVRGGAPATRETDLLDPANTVEGLHAVVLSGGSAFGLDAASGVMRWLSEQGFGLEFGGQQIPIVAGACLFDLPLGNPQVRPDAEWGYTASANASHRLRTGNVGAGTGASVGKLLGMEQAMKCGLGAASLQLGEMVVSAVTVVNAVGNVYANSRSTMLAGVRDPKRPRSILDPYQALFGQVVETTSKPSPRLPSLGNTSPIGRLTDPAASAGMPGTNTTISCVLTNASMSKAEATRVAGMAHDGYARAIDPVHTANDGDVVFVMATGQMAASHDLIGILAARTVEAAIINAAIDAEGAYGLPAHRDLVG
ncbi:MAG: P1 family peptidase [Actinomycetia bacterium]|nr:P1 family peptidase [Actinomycetes bacterium]